MCQEILDTRSGVLWDDIAGQEDAKRLVQELVVWPMLNPHLFQARLLADQPCTTHLIGGGACVVRRLGKCEAGIRLPCGQDRVP